MRRLESTKLPPTGFRAIHRHLDASFLHHPDACPLGCLQTISMMDSTKFSTRQSARSGCQKLSSPATVIMDVPLVTTLRTLVKKEHCNQDDQLFRTHADIINNRESSGVRNRQRLDLGTNSKVHTSRKRGKNGSLRDAVTLDHSLAQR